MSPENDPELISPVEIADLAHVSRAAVANWARRHDDFPAVDSKSGRSVRYRRAEVLRWLERNGKLTSDPAERVLRDFLEALRIYGLSGAEAARAGVSTVGAAMRDPLASFDPQFLPRGLIAGGVGADHRLDAVSESYIRLREVASTAEDALALVDGFLNLLSDGGRSGEHGDPPDLQELVAGIAAPQPGDVIYDPVAGSGRLLARTALRTDNATAYGQELNEESAELARAVLGALGISGEIAGGDTLTEDHFPELDADRVVAVPPFGLRSVGEIEELDPRWRFPNAKDPLFYFVQHALHHLAAGGRAVFVSTTGPLFASRDRATREFLTRERLLEGVIRLPTGVFRSMGVQLAVLIFRAPADASAMSTVPDTWFIEVSDDQDPCREAARVWADRELGGEAVAVPIADIAAQDYSWDSGRYVSDGREPVDVDSLRQQIRMDHEALRSSIDRMQDLCLALGPQLDAIGERTEFPEVREARLDEVVQVIAGRAVKADAELDIELAVPVLRGSDLESRELVAERWTESPNDASRLTAGGDVALSLLGDRTRLRVIGGHEAGWYPDAHVAVLRITDARAIDPQWLEFWIRSPLFATQVRRLASGSTVRRLSPRDVKALRILLPPPDPALQRALSMQVSAAAELVGALDQVRDLADRQLSDEVLLLDELAMRNATGSHSSARMSK